MIQLKIRVDTPKGLNATMDADSPSMLGGGGGVEIVILNYFVNYCVNYFVNIEILLGYCKS